VQEEHQSTHDAADLLTDAALSGRPVTVEYEDRGVEAVVTGQCVKVDSKIAAIVLTRGAPPDRIHLDSVIRVRWRDDAMRDTIAELREDEQPEDGAEGEKGGAS